MGPSGRTAGARGVEEGLGGGVMVEVNRKREV